MLGIPEGIMDGVVSGLVACATSSEGQLAHWQVYSSNEVHGPAEVAFASEHFAASNSCSACREHRQAGLHGTRSAAPREPRRVHQGRESRVAFINTGFSTAPVTRCTRRWKRPDDPQGRHEVVAWIQATSA